MPEEDEEEMKFGSECLDRNTTALPSERFFGEIGNRPNAYDARKPDVTDIDMEDLFTDIDLEEYYYGWATGKHYSKYGHPWVLKEDMDMFLFNLREPVPLTCPYEVAQREDERIQGIIFDEIDQQKFVGKKEFEKWMASIGTDEKPDEPIRKQLYIESGARRSPWLRNGKWKKPVHPAGYKTIDDLEDALIFPGKSTLDGFRNGW